LGGTLTAWVDGLGRQKLMLMWKHCRSQSWITVSRAWNIEPRSSCLRRSDGRPSRSWSGLKHSGREFTASRPPNESS